MQQITYRANFLKLSAVAFDFSAFSAAKGFPPHSLRIFLVRLSGASCKHGGGALVACMDAITAVYQIYLASYFHAVESAAARRCTA